MKYQNKEKEEKLPAELAHEYFTYDPKTGVLKWRVSRGGMKRGSVAGSLHSGGYRQVGVFGLTYFVHRIAWLMDKGEWPADQLDHINGVCTDNRICNLRPVSHTENLKNQKVYRNNTSGVVGVYKDAKSGKWRARIKVNGKTKSLGYYDTIEKAEAAIEEARHKYGFHVNHGKLTHERAASGFTNIEEFLK